MPHSNNERVYLNSVNGYFYDRALRTQGEVSAWLAQWMYTASNIPKLGKVGIEISTEPKLGKVGIEISTERNHKESRRTSSIPKLGLANCNSCYFKQVTEKLSRRVLLGSCVAEYYLFITTT